MPLDHYVSQVHLKNFYSTELGELMYAIKKSDQKLFTPNAQSVCRIDEGSTNTYLSDERIIEEFLKEIEPKYNTSVSQVLNCQFDTESIYVVAGFISYVLSCSPAAMRIHSEMFRGTVEETAKQLDKNNEIPPPPAQLGGKSLTELLENGKVSIKIDEKYPQAHGITSVFSHIATFGNSAWEILINPFIDSPFFSSDYPVAIEQSNNPQVHNRIVPLTPYLAIRIIPNVHLNRSKPDFSFSSFRYKKNILSRQEVRAINQLIVRCAESMVFFSKMESWIVRFVKSNSQYRIEPSTVTLPNANGSLLLFNQEVLEYKYKYKYE